MSLYEHLLLLPQSAEDTSQDESDYYEYSIFMILETFTFFLFLFDHYD